MPNLQVVRQRQLDRVKNTYRRHKKSIAKELEIAKLIRNVKSQ